MHRFGSIIESGKSNYLAPISKDFPEFGSGGATQAVYTKEVRVMEVKNLKTGEVIYKGQ